MRVAAITVLRMVSCLSCTYSGSCVLAAAGKKLLGLLNKQTNGQMTLVAQKKEKMMAEIKYYLLSTRSVCG